MPSWSVESIGLSSFLILSRSRVSDLISSLPAAEFAYAVKSSEAERIASAEKGVFASPTYVLTNALSRENVFGSPSTGAASGTSW